MLKLKVLTETAFTRIKNTALQRICRDPEPSVPHIKHMFRNSERDKRIKWLIVWSIFSTEKKLKPPAQEDTRKHIPVRLFRFGVRLIIVLDSTDVSWHVEFLCI